MYGEIKVSISFSLGDSEIIKTIFVDGKEWEKMSEEDKKSLIMDEFRNQVSVSYFDKS